MISIHAVLKFIPTIKTNKYLYILLYKAVRPSAFFWSSGSSPWMQGSMSNLLEMKRPSSGNTKFVFITS